MRDIALYSQGTVQIRTWRIRYVIQYIYALSCEIIVQCSDFIGVLVICDSADTGI